MTRSAPALGWIALLALLAVGCRAARTEIVLRVDTNIQQGSASSALSDVRIVLTSATDATPFYSATQHLDPSEPMVYPPLPDTLGINAHGNQAGRELTVQIFGIIGGTERITYTAIVPFAQGRITFLNAFLGAQCIDVRCDPGMTCGPYGGCVDAHQTSLPDFDAATLDAPVVEGGGPTDATDIAIRPDGDGGCPSGTTECAGHCVELANDTLNCGVCAHDCTTLANSIGSAASCAMGVCHFVCATGFADCDLTAGNGCEADATSTTHCGSCTHACATGEVCSPGDAGYDCASACPPGLTSCLSACTNTTTDVMNCGACSATCPVDPHGVATCVAGTCGTLCATGYHLCHGVCASDSDLSTCGGSCDAPCGDPPHATGTCSGTACGMTCVAGFADCDGVMANGCETDLSAPLTCGGCHTACSGTTPVCSPLGATYACTTTCTPHVACNTGNPCTLGQTSCSGSMSSCVVTSTYGDGTACGAGHVCNHGVCSVCPGGTGCSTGNPCHGGSITCGTGAPVCTPLPSVVTPGTPCGSGAPPMVCSMAGNCVACTGGAPCMLSNPCEVGATDCSSGAAVCRLQGHQTAGTTCPSGTCDGMGTCSMCVSSVCTLSPCSTGLFNCTSRMCASPTTYLSPGATCGSGMVCDGAGGCGACMSMAPCDEGECSFGTTSCATGHPVCMLSGYQGDGMPCGTGGGMSCDGMGNCVTPDAGFPDAGFDAGDDGSGDAMDDSDDGFVTPPFDAGVGPVTDS